jgi:5'-nucleotidase
MLTVAVSSRSLFHMEEENALFDSKDQTAYDAHMRETETVPLMPGSAFSLVRKLLMLNTTRSPQKPDRVEVVLLSRNSANAGVRVMNSVMHYGLNIE